MSKKVKGKDISKNDPEKIRLYHRLGELEEELQLVTKINFLIATDYVGLYPAGRSKPSINEVLDRFKDKAIKMKVKKKK